MHPVRLTGLLTFHYFLFEVCRPATTDVKTVHFLSRGGHCCVRAQDSVFVCELNGGNQLTFEGAALFISRGMNVREPSSIALRGNRNQRGQRPR